MHRQLLTFSAAFSLASSSLPRSANRSQRWVTTREVVEVEEAVGVTVVEAEVVDAEEVCFCAPRCLASSASS